MERRVRFELLYGRHAPAVKAYVLRRAPASLADDLVAEVFVVCWRRFEEVPADALPWLLGVARRVLSTHRRGERRSVALRDRLAQTSAPPVDMPAGTSSSLLAAMRQLSDADRELLALIAWEGLSVSQAAIVLDARAATVRVRLHRARRRLSLALAREELEPSACSALPMEASP
jgi:RNA polymerase sigma-70 factor (ECF subfamily)